MIEKSANRNTAKYDIERQYIVFFHSDVNMSWNESDVGKFRMLWKNGRSALEIAKIFGRPPMEVILLIMDQAEQELIELRSTGIFGM